MNDRCDETETCECNACLGARADFQRWADAFEARWAKRKRLVVYHIDGNPRNNDLSNLKLERAS